MTHRYSVETAAEAGRVVERLVASGYEATAEQTPQGYVVLVETAAPSVTIEEILLRDAPSARTMNDRSV